MAELPKETNYWEEAEEFFSKNKENITPGTTVIFKEKIIDVKSDFDDKAFIDLVMKVSPDGETFSLIPLLYNDEFEAKNPDIKPKAISMTEYFNDDMDRSFMAQIRMGDFTEDIIRLKEHYNIPLSKQEGDYLGEILGDSLDEADITDIVPEEELVVAPDDISSIDTPTNVVDDAPKSLQQVYDNLYNKPLKPGGVEANQANSFSKLRPDGTKVVVHFSLVNEILDNYGLEKTQLGAWENEAENVLDIILDTQYKILKDKGIQESPRGFFGGNYTSVSPEEFKQIIPKLNNYFLGKEVLLDSEDYLDESGEGLKLKYKGNPIVPTDTPGGSLGAAKLNDPLVFDSWVDNYAKTTTSFVDNLPLSTTVKNQFNNIVQGRAKNLATPGGVADAVDVWELGVLGLMIAAVAYKEYDEIPTILKNKTIDMFNAVLAPYNIPPVPKEQYDLNYEFINKVVETGEKFMPTDIIIKKVGDVVKGAAETGAVTGFGYVPPNLTKTDTMETTQKIQPGVQEEKMFEQAKPQKGSGGGSGAKIL